MTKIHDDISVAAEKFAPILKGLGNTSLGVSIAAAIGHRSDEGILSMYRLAASITLSDGNHDLLSWLLDLGEEILVLPVELRREARKRFPNSLQPKVWRDVMSLENALWKAMVVVTLPALDRIRLRYIEKYDFWEEPWQQLKSENIVDDRQKLELGDLRDQAFNHDRNLGYGIANFARMRNEVCHLRLLKIGDLRRIEAFQI